jgi:hypothetical protein
MLSVDLALSELQDFYFVYEVLLKFLCSQIAASLLLFMEEEDVFWMMCTIIEDLLPASYYSSTLIGVQVMSGPCLFEPCNWIPAFETYFRSHYFL